MLTIIYEKPYNCFMELDVLEKEAEEIDFDFLKQPLSSTKSENRICDETLVIVLKTNNAISSDFSVCGKSLIDWVKLSSAMCKQKVLDEPSEEEFLSKIREASEGFKFVVVLYSDTPLLQRETFLKILDYFSNKKMNVLKLERGYVFKQEFLENAKMILSSVYQKFGDEDFFRVCDAESVSMAFEILNERILDYHKKNGVVMFGEGTIFVDADVEIEEGVLIFSNNTICGHSVIGKNVVLESGNVIFDTEICDGAKISNCVLKNCKVKNRKIVGPFENLCDKEI